MYSLDQRIRLLSQWGNTLQKAWNEDALSTIIEQEHLFFPWAVKPFVQIAMADVIQILNENFLYEYVSGYENKIVSHESQQIGVIMSCNTPLSGMEMIVPILLTGNIMLSKACDDNRRLLAAIVVMLDSVDENMKNAVNLNHGVLRGVQKMIMPCKYAQTNVGNIYIKNKYPTLVLQENYSVAVLTGKETSSQLSLLAKDMMLYFGMGQGSVKCVMVPSDYNFASLFKAMDEYQHIAGMHHKYLNNLEYQKTLHLFHSIPFMDQGLMLFTEKRSQLPPMAVMYYQHYDSEEQLQNILLQLDTTIYHNEGIPKEHFGRANALKNIMLNQKHAVLSFLLE